MRIVVDKTGFPFLEIDNLGAFGLWPVTKIQYERHISETNSFGDKLYDVIVKMNPRVSTNEINKENYEGVFITGITPQEAINYANWIGPGFGLPTIDEWRKFYMTIKDESIPVYTLSGLSIKATDIWNHLYKRMKKMRDFALFEGGLVEWVTEKDKYVGVGKPRQHFHPNTYDPQKDSIKPLKERIYYFGFRLIKRYNNDH